MAKVYDKAGEKLVILATREGVVQQFVATQWRDLRVGMFLSITSATDDDDPDDPPTMTETITSTDLPPADRHWIGVKNNLVALPFELNSPFIGFTNTDPGVQSHTHNGKLVGSDLAIGTTGTNWWRSKADEGGTFGIWEGTTRLRAANNTTQALDPHFPRVVSGAGGYAVLLAFRMQRSTAESNQISVQVPHPATHRSDMGFTNDPSQEALDAALETWTPNVISFGSVTLQSVPNSLFCYWPYRFSRLRIHCWGLFKNR